MAIIDWTDLLGWKEDELESLRFVTYSFIKQGKYDIALIFLEALLVIDPNNAYDLQTLGAIYLQLGKSVQALNYIDQALKINPDHYPSLINRAKALFSLGYNQQAIAQAEKLATCDNKKISDEASALLICYNK